MSAPLLDKPSLPDADPTAGRLAALAELLEQEYAALRRADAAAVVRIASQKRQLTDALATIGRADAGAFKPPAALGELTQRCQALNRRNGELLHLQQSMLTRAMRVLSGSDSSPGVYGARGQTQPSPGGRHIASV
jgi:flagellar biosynthesis/type III secretory pathway chaperone